MPNSWDEATEKRVLLAALKLYKGNSSFNNEGLDFLVTVASSAGQQFNRNGVRQHINTMLAKFDPGVPIPGQLSTPKTSSFKAAEDKNVTPDPKGAAAVAGEEKSPIQFTPFKIIPKRPTPIRQPLSLEQLALRESKRKREKDADQKDKVDETPSKRVKIEKATDDEENHDGDSEVSTDIQVSSGAEV
ncbi:MAG: hypothetical protein Q9214_002156 [Letrouitia sp. 1 TL-2023]